MHKYIAKRLLLMIPVIVGISFIIFSIMSFMPGNPARLILGEKATADAIAALNEQMGLNDPFIIRYFRYMGDVLTGNFGISYRTGMPVVEEIVRRFPTTAKLAVLSVFFATIIGLPLGILSAVKQYSWIDSLTTVLGLHIHASVLAGINADYSLFGKAGNSSFFRFRFLCAFYSAGYHQFGVHLCDAPANDAFHHAGSHTSGLCNHGIRKRS